MLKKLFLFSLVIMMGIAGFLGVKHAQAQQAGLNLTVSPTLMDLSVDPGAKITQTFRVRNNGSTPLTLHIQVDKLSPDSQNGQVLPLVAQKSDTFISWMQFDQTNYKANPGEWKDITFTINIPKDAAFGYYYALRIGQDSKDVKTTANTKILGEVIVPVLVNVKNPGAKADAQLVSFTPSSFINEYLPVSFQTTIKNTGNVHLKPHGNIFINAVGDKNLGILDINQGLGNVLPGGSRTFSSSWDDGFLVQEPIIEDGVAKLDKNNKPATHIVINWNKLTSFRIGKYTAHMLFVYDNGKRDVSVEATTTFWVFPWKVIIGLLVVIIGLIFIIRLWLKWYVKRQIKKYQKN